MSKRRIAGAIGVIAIVLGACTSGPGASPKPSLPTAVGEGEGEVSVLAWPGYVENGSTDQAVNWVKPFEDATGCKVTVQVFGTSDEAFSLFTTNPEKFDVMSASGDASLRLVRAGFVEAVNTDLVKNYADIFPAPQGQGLQHGRRRPLRNPPRPRVEPADVAHRRSHAGSDQVGPDVRPDLALRRQGLGL